MNQRLIVTLIFLPWAISCRRPPGSTAPNEAAHAPRFGDGAATTVDLNDLALHRNDWPTQIRVNVRIKTVILREGKKVGEVELQPNTELKLEEVNGEQLTVSIGSMTHTIDADATDLIQQVIAIRENRHRHPLVSHQTPTASALSPPQPAPAQKIVDSRAQSERSGIVHVRGYYRKNGSYVQPYDRTSPQ